MPNFQHLLSKSLDEVKKPEALPAGTYYGVITKFEYGESQQKKTPYVRFSIRLTEAGDDIEPDTLPDGGLGGRQLRRDYYFTPDAEYRLKDFLGSLGIETAGRSFGETIPESVNQEVMVTVTQRMVTRDGVDEPVNDVGSCVGRKE